VKFSLTLLIKINLSTFEFLEIMEKYKNIIILIIIIIGLASGVMIGSNTDDLKENELTDNNSLPVLLDSGSSEFFLIVGVNDIHETTTELESLWLVEIEDGSFIIKLNALYPFSENTSYQIPHDPIMVSSAGPMEIFELGFLSLESIDHLIILDKAAFWTLIQLSDLSVELPIDHNQGTYFDDYPHAWDAPSQAYDYQIDVISYLCKHSTPFSEAERVDEMIKLINNYLFTDLSIEDMLSYWQNLFENDFTFTCEIK
jgi:hypothetical protein